MDPLKALWENSKKFFKGISHNMLVMGRCYIHHTAEISHEPIGFGVKKNLPL